MYVYMFIHIYIYMYMYEYVHLYILIFMYTMRVAVKHEKHDTKLSTTASAPKKVSRERSSSRRNSSSSRVEALAVMPEIMNRNDAADGTHLVCYTQYHNNTHTANNKMNNNTNITASAAWYNCHLFLLRMMYTHAIQTYLMYIQMVERVEKERERMKVLQDLGIFPPVYHLSLSIYSFHTKTHS